ncbi:MAG: acyl-CoA thioesterase [Paracoccaceae bacterium]
MTLRYHAPLTPEEQRAAGLEVPQTLAIADRVRFSELDMLNHVNNKAYFTWFETLRVEYGQRFVHDYFESEPRAVLRGGEVRFVKEMVEGESYVATARVSAFRNSSYTIEQQIWSGDLRATFSAVMVMLLPDGSGRMPLPPALREAFETRDGARPDS